MHTAALMRWVLFNFPRKLRREFLNKQCLCGSWHVFFSHVCCFCFSMLMGCTETAGLPLGNWEGALIAAAQPLAPRRVGQQTSAAICLCWPFFMRLWKGCRPCTAKSWLLGCSCCDLYVFLLREIDTCSLKALFLCNVCR